MPSNLLFLGVALAIALIAFGLGQWLPGLGAPFVILATTAWVAYSIARRRKVASKLEG